MNTVLAVILVTTGALLAGPASAQPKPDWPQRPVRLVVPFAPGGATDIVGRILAPGLAETIGQPVLVDNRAGAAGNIGIEMVARAQPDGQTVLIGNVSTASINPILFAHVLQVKPETDLTGVTLLASIPNLLVAGAAFPPATLAELIAWAKARPGQVNVSGPLGSFSHLDMLDFAARAGFSAVHIPAPKGAGASLPPLMAGEIHFTIMNSATVLPLIRAGKLKAYATTGLKRMPELPDVPTLAEAGFPGSGSDNWNGLFVPAKTPAAIVERLFVATTQAMQREPIRDAFAKANVPVTLSRSPAEFNAFVRDELRRWARIIKANDIRIDP
jgi:tripartite-type tricarboxylate transporter receptor subunit TctC